MYKRQDQLSKSYFVPEREAGSASFEQTPPALDGYGEVMSTDGLRVTLRVPKAETSRATARLLTDLSVVDLTVEDPPIDDVIEKVFSSQLVS